MLSDEFNEPGTSIERLPDVNIAANPKRLEESRRRCEESMSADQRWLSEAMIRANGRKIVRKSGWVERCVWIGILVRETKHYFFYAANAHVEGVDEASCKQLRVSKAVAHLEPCHCCDDHPNNAAGMPGTVSVGR